MTAFQFIASIIGSVAWPVVIIVIVILLRVPLSQIISSLTLHKLTYKDWQIDFGQEIAKLTLTADDANIPEIEKTGEQEEQGEKAAQLEPLENRAKELEIKLNELEERIAHTGTEQSHQADGKKVDETLALEFERQKLENEKLRFELDKALSTLATKGSVSKDEQILRLAISIPPLAVVAAMEDLAHEIISAVKRLEPNGQFSQIKSSVRRYIDFLEHKGHIDNETANILRDMLTLRNKAAHSYVKSGEITSVEALEYVQLAKRMIQLLASLKNHQYKSGDKVRHDKFGVGTILKSDIIDGTEFLDVQFGGANGNKRLSMDFAKLEKL